MKSHQMTIWGVLFLFFFVMTAVVSVSFLRKSNSTGIDPARIRDLRESYNAAQP